MFCTNCGSEMPDDSVFCTNCGAKIGELPSTGNQDAAINPVYNNFEHSNNNNYPTNVHDNVQNNQTVQNYNSVPTNNYVPSENNTMNYNYNNSYVNQNPFPIKNNMFLCIIGSFIALLAAAAGITEFIYFGGFSLKVEDMIPAIMIIIVSVFVVVNGIMENRLVSILTGIAFLSYLGLDLYFVGYSTLESSIDWVVKFSKFGSTFYFYCITLIVSYVLLYLFAFLAGIRNLFYTKGMKFFTVLIGYITMLSTIALIIQMADLNNKVIMIYDILPYNLVYTLFVFGSVLVISGKRKIKN